MKTISKSLLTLLLFFLAFSCHKEKITEETEQTIPDPEMYYETYLMGQVTDLNGLPLEGAEVSWGSSFENTDENGYFRIVGTVPEKMATLRVRKENYFDAIQVLSVESQLRINLTVQLSPISIAGFLSSSEEGGTVDLFGKGTVAFQANSFEDELGNPYSGLVNVYAFYLDPTDPKLAAKMPGNLMGTDENRESRLLTSYGMVNIELTSNTGLPLQLKRKATLTLNIPSHLANTAPSNIRLSYFDETTSLWKDEGMATKQGDTYVGEISDFSWWNFDIPEDFIYLTGHVSYDSMPSAITLRLTALEDASMGILTVDHWGDFAGFVPKEKELLLEMIDLCGNSVYSEEIGPFQEDTSLPIKNTVFTSGDDFLLTGFVKNCLGKNSTNSYLKIEGIPGNPNYVLGGWGWYDIRLFACGANQITITAYDLEYGTESEPLTLQIEEDNNFGNLNSCGGDLEESFDITIDGITDFYSPCSVAFIPGSGLSGTFEFRFSIPHSGGSVEYQVYVEGVVVNSNEVELTYESFEWTSNGAPYEFYYDFDGVAQSEIIKLSTNEMPGDILHLVVDDFDLVKKKIDGSTETLIGSSLHVKATLE